MPHLLKFVLAIVMAFFTQVSWAGHMFTQGSANVPTWISSGTGIAVNQVGRTNSGNGLENSQSIFQIYLEAPNPIPSGTPAPDTSSSAWWQWSTGDVMKLSISTTAGLKDYTLAYDGASGSCAYSACAVAGSTTVGAPSNLISEVRGLTLALPSGPLTASNMFTWTIAALSGEFSLGGFRIGFANGTLDGSSTGPLNQSSVVSVASLPSGSVVSVANLPSGGGGAVVPDIVSGGNGSVNLVSTIAGNASPKYNNRFDGGVLQVDAAGSFANNFTITSNGATLDQAGVGSTFSGVFSNDTTDTSAAARNLSVTNTGSGGSVTLTGANTYTGTTTVGSGANLALGSAGSIETSSEVVANGTFDIASTNSGASIKSLSGSGSVITASSKALNLTAAAGNFAGLISGAGGVVISGGTETLSGVNSYTGSTLIGTGSTLALSGSGSVATSSGVVVNGILDISNTASVASITTLSGNGSAVTASGKSLTLTNASDTFNGVVSGNGRLVISSGSETLAGINTHTGGTQVDAGASLSIASSSALGLGVLDLVGSATVPATLRTTADVVIANAITVSGDPVFTVTPGTVTTINSVISNGASPGDVVLNGGGILNLTAVNTYTGLTTIDAGILQLTGSGSIAGSNAVANNAVLDVTSASGNVALGGTYTQAASGTLKMTVAPVSNQQVNVAGAANLNGAMDLAALAGTYRAGRYTLLTSGGLAGSTFSALSTNLSAVTNHTYSLGYDANNVYLDLRSSAVDTMLSIKATTADLNKIFMGQYAVAQVGLSYDCKLFDIKDLCLSTGARVTKALSNGTRYDGAALIAAYRAAPDVRIGAWLDQNDSHNMITSVAAQNSTPMFGAFVAWNENPGSLQGMEIKLSTAYAEKNLSFIRPVFGTSELGQGNSKLTTFAADASVSYGVKMNDRATVAPFAGLRYANLANSGYTEKNTIFSPLTFEKSARETQSLIVGLNLYDRAIADIGLTMSAGVEHYLKAREAMIKASGLVGLDSVQMTRKVSNDRPFISAMLSFYLSKEQQLVIGLSHTRNFTESEGATSATVKYVLGL
jgi:autotransporter-associated beta strand protein